MSEGKIESHPSKRLPRLLNPRKLAYSEAQLLGLVDSEALTRLAEAADCTGDIRARLDFSVNDAGKVLLEGEVEADLAFQCQRCMQMMPHATQTARLSISVVRDEDEAKQLPKALDPWIVAEDEGDIFALIEEELLLVAPVAAYHDYECIDASLYSSGDVDERESVKEPGPFSVLGELKKH